MGFVLTLFIAYKSDFGPVLVAWLNGVTAWRFLFSVALVLWAVYILYRCKTWLEQKLTALSNATTQLYNRVSSIYQEHEKRFDALGHAIEHLNRPQ